MNLKDKQACFVPFCLDTKISSFFETVLIRQMIFRSNLVSSFMHQLVCFFFLITYFSTVHEWNLYCVRLYELTICISEMYFYCFIKFSVASDLIDISFSINRFGVDTAPALVFLKDPGLEPTIYQGILLYSSSFEVICFVVYSMFVEKIMRYLHLLQET